MKPNSDIKLDCWVRAGEVERGKGKRYKRLPGYGLVTYHGSMTYPWSTYTEARRESKQHGNVAIFCLNVEEAKRRYDEAFKKWLSKTR